MEKKAINTCVFKKTCSPQTTPVQHLEQLPVMFSYFSIAQTHNAMRELYPFAAIAISILVFCLSHWNWFAAKHRQKCTVALVEYFMPQMSVISKAVFHSG